MDNRNRTIKKAINNLKASGHFDATRRQCLEQIDASTNYQALLNRRVEGVVESFLGRQSWSPALNKGQLRAQLRDEIFNSEGIRSGVRSLVDQVVDERVKKEFKNVLGRELREHEKEEDGKQKQKKKKKSQDDSEAMTPEMDRKGGYQQ